MDKINTTKTSKNFFKLNVTYRGIGIDIAKNFLSVCTIDDDVVNYQAKMFRDELVRQFAPFRQLRIVIESCSGSAELAKRISTWYQGQPSRQLCWHSATVRRTTATIQWSWQG